MEFFRRATNPWGQDVLVGIAWDLMWAAVIVGVLFVVAHAIYVWRLAPKEEPGADLAAEPSTNVPEQVVRHTLSSRLFHWLMTAAMFALLITAFFPVIGIRFPWVTIHWIAGIGLVLTIVYHVVRATLWQDFWSMWIDRKEIQEGTADVKRFLGRSTVPQRKAGKYPLDHKLFHHVIAAVSIAAIATGLLMMFRVDTPFWVRNPYVLSDGLWGVVYVLHGLSGVALITMITAHIYFAIRPEKLWITRSMINGWIGRKEYLAHHDPQRWVVAPNAPQTLAGAGSSTSPSQSAQQDKQPVG
jgi:cytochrome b subunit of formate dehydrogenase